jgi:shikimate dehydrogenase
MPWAGKVQIPEGAHILMNTTHLGAAPEQEPVPGNWKTIPKDITVIDVITDPRITLFLKAARDKYCAIAGGVEMLMQLAMQIFEEWTGITPDEALFQQAVAEVLGE